MTRAELVPEVFREPFSKTCRGGEFCSRKAWYRVEGREGQYCFQHAAKAARGGEPAVRAARREYLLNKRDADLERAADVERGRLNDTEGLVK
jgi:hypothetical protein